MCIYKHMHVYNHVFHQIISMIVSKYICLVMVNNSVSSTKLCYICAYVCMSLVIYICVMCKIRNNYRKFTFTVFTVIWMSRKAASCWTVIQDNNVHTYICTDIRVIYLCMSDEKCKTDNCAHSPYIYNTYKQKVVRI